MAREKTILVTGSTDGVGKLVAAKLAAQGAKVLIHGRNQERGESLLAEIKTRPAERPFFIRRIFPPWKMCGDWLRR